jgi:hypothetical protein
MKHGSSKHQGKRQLRPVASEDYEVRGSTFEQMPHKLPGASEDFYGNSHSFELLRPENQYKVRGSTSEQTAHKLPSASEDFYVKYSSYDLVRPEHQNQARVDYYNQPTTYKVYEEEDEVNTEADDFIKYEHKKFQLSKTMTGIFGWSN